jgi:hypothetical protein
MGIEAFGISMRLIEPGIFDRVAEKLASFDYVRMNKAETAVGFQTTIGEYNDGTHLIELQILREISTDKSTLAVRFSLCSYETIDSIFIMFANNILSLFEAEVWLMTSALKLKANYLPGDEKWLIAALPDEISAMRQQWQQSFGNKQGFVRVKDSFSFIGLKLKQ